MEVVALRPLVEVVHYEQVVQMVQAMADQTGFPEHYEEHYLKEEPMALPEVVERCEQVVHWEHSTG